MFKVLRTKTEDVKQKLISAVQDGDLEKFKRLTSGLNDHFLSSWSPGFDLLCQALKNEHLEIAKLLVGHGCQLKIGSQKTTALHVAVLHGDVTVIKMIRDRTQKVRYISRICSTRDLDEKGMAVLHILAQRRPVNEKRSEVLDHLLSFSNIDIKHAVSGFTPMHFAAECGNVEMIPILLKKNATINIKSYRDNCTPLHVAVGNGHSETVRELLMHQADPNAGWMSPTESEDHKEYTHNMSPLHIAAEKEHLETLLLLLEYGAKPDVVDKFGRTPLHIAVKNGSLSIVTALLNSNCEISSFFIPEKPSGYSPLHIAVALGNEDFVKLFLDKGISVDSTTQTGYTALHLAAQKENTIIVELLIEYNANPSSKGPTAIETPLFFAAKIGSSKIVEILCQAIITSKNEEWLEGYASLFVAAYYGHEDIVRRMLDHGVKPNANFGKYLTPLQAAAQMGHESIVYLLLEHGAEVNPDGDNRRSRSRRIRRRDDCEANKKFSNPFIAACLSGHKAIVKILLDHGADMNVEVTSKPEKINSEVERLLTYGYYSYSEFLSAGYNLGYSPIHFGSASGDEEIVKMLLQNGADVNAKGDDGGTPLCVAVKHQHEVVVACLLENGSSTDAEESGQSVLLTAIATNNLKIVEMLLNFNASINTTSFFGEKEDCTPLHLAVMKSTMPIVELLLKRGSVVDVSSTKQDIPLHVAVERNDNEDIIRKLIEYGASVNFQCSRGLTPLFHALLSRDMQVFKFLLKKGASFDTKTTEGVSLLQFAIDSRLQFDDIRFIVEFGADLNDNELKLSSSNCTAKLLKLLLKFGLDVNSQIYSSGQTILHYACRRSLTDLIIFLLRQDANLNILDVEGRTALWYSVEKAHAQWESFEINYRGRFKNDQDRQYRMNLRFTDCSAYKIYYDCEKYHRKEMDSIDESTNIARILVQEATRLQAAGKKLNSENSFSLKRSFTRDYYDLCKAELLKLKEKKVFGSVSWFDILIASEIKLSHYARNFEIKNTLHNNIKNMRDSQCAIILKARFERSEERIYMMEKTATFLKQIVQLQIPIEVTDEILNYLRVCDLRNFCRACEPFIFISKRRVDNSSDECTSSSSDSRYY